MITTYERRFSFTRQEWYDAPVYEYEVGDAVLIRGISHTVTDVIERPNGGFHGVGRYEVECFGVRAGSVTGYFISPDRSV